MLMLGDIKIEEKKFCRYQTPVFLKKIKILRKY